MNGSSIGTRRRSSWYCGWAGISLPGRKFKETVLEFTGRPRAAGPQDRLLAALSVRERQILAAVVSGRSNSEIGAALFVSEKTVRNSLTRISEKLGVRTRTRAAILARDRGFSGPSDAAE